MKQVFDTVVGLLTRAAQERAQGVMQAQARTDGGEDYRSNAGGWN